MILKNKVIFILEDQVPNRAIMQLLLEREGATVIFERWGFETVKRMKESPQIDIALLDLMLPRGITGYDVFDMIRSEKEFENIPIVAVSASDTAVAIPKTKTKGFAGFIHKPVDYDLFPKQIAMLLTGVSIWIEE
jgi:CheY-like chemotaxis protein